MARQWETRAVAIPDVRDTRPYPRGLSVWLLLACLAVLIGGTACTLVGGSGTIDTNVRTSAVPAQSFTISGQPALVIHDDVGVITVHNGGSNNVSVKGTKRLAGSGGDFNNISIKSEQSGNTVNVTATVKHDIANTQESANLDVTLPATANVEVHVDAGGVTINGITGQLVLDTQAAAIDVEGATLKGRSQLTASAGAITFKGTLDPQGKYLFKTDVGKIDVTLPPDSAFALKSSVSLGKVSNDFGSDSVGSGPRAQLEIDTSTGVINVHKGS